jgi:hypothetical protein
MPCCKAERTQGFLDWQFAAKLLRAVDVLPCGGRSARCAAFPVPCISPLSRRGAGAPDSLALLRRPRDGALCGVLGISGLEDIFLRLHWRGLSTKEMAPVPDEQALFDHSGLCISLISGGAQRLLRCGPALALRGYMDHSHSVAARENSCPGSGQIICPGEPGSVKLRDHDLRAVVHPVEPCHPITAAVTRGELSPLPRLGKNQLLTASSSGHPSCLPRFWVWCSDSERNIHLSR